MKKLALLTTAVMFAIAGQAVAGEKIRIATEGAYAPWNYKDSAGNLIGFELDLAKDLCARMKADCTVVEQAWDGIIPALQAGKYDAIMAGMSITDKRKKIISFSRAYASTPAKFVVLKSSPAAGFKTMEADINLMEVSKGEKMSIGELVATFKGKTIGVQVGTTHLNFLNEYLGKDVTVKTYDTQENLDLDLQAGRVDAALASMSYWAPLLKGDKGKDMIAVGPNLTGGPFGAGVGVGIRQADKKTVEMFSKAINESIAAGVVSKLAIQHFGFDASVK